ncbi:MAG: hypothetical protein GY715_08815 [Planctomycetes bacterium]|nr:hypothetical protein [Planctomycetota bacterium]
MKFPGWIAMAVVLGGCAAGPEEMPATTHPGAGTEPWREAEAGKLDNHVQLTFADRFVRAGEAYFSPGDRMVIFQAIEQPPPGVEPSAHYQMYVADLVRDRAGRITGIDRITQLSPPGSSNTCGWFHPTKKDHVIFGSTIAPPAAPAKAGYQREGGKYVWQFPKEMTIVECDLTRADGTARTLRPLVEDPNAYLAECALNADGSKLVYCRRVESEGALGGDLVIRDLRTGRDTVVADNDGYDGGPFFSPDGRSICYRSDRQGNDLLQVFVGDLSFDGRGRVTGLAREHQLTDNEHVNWAPYWHPSGRHLIYTTSELGHRNYEVFAIDAPDDRGRSGNHRRVTHADGFDGLPVFNADASLMMWTSQRDEGRTSQIWLAEFVMDLDSAP